jgi:membrane-associated phospholipid phosphatase
LAVSVLFLVCAFRGSAQNMDIDLLRDINLHRNKRMDGTMKAITNFDYPVSIAAPIGELAWGYSKGDKTAISNGWQTVGGFAINGALTFGLKYAVNRPRPYATYKDLQPYETYTEQSFPSGHSSFAFCTATSLSICYPKWYVIGPSYLWAAAVGYSRLHLGVHYPSDVLAGAIVGAGSAWLAYKGNKWLKKRLKGPQGTPGF